TIRLWNDDFKPLAAERLTFTLTPPGGQPITWPAVQAQDGSWQVDVIALSQPGNWKAAIDAGLDAKHRLTLDAPILIEPEQ
ncbi:MAG: hypothetical protein WBO12_14655, partial [Xanthobacteraceae bacterium]